MSRRERISANPLTSAEVGRFVLSVPEWYRDFYTVWFHLGWRSSEIVALRCGWIDFDRLHLKLHRGRIPRMGGLEAEPETVGARSTVLMFPRFFARWAP